MHFIGRTFSHYRVVKKLGAGGMGIVCQAVDTRLGRSVALKFLSDGLSGRPLALARFQREARAASALNHPNICTLYDIGEQDGKVFLVLEFLEGETLQDRTGRGPCQPVEFFRLATQILGALEAAHDAAILHRDIKPANIFITARGEAKILDFGLAKLQEIESPKFRSNETAPPAYRAVTAATVDEDITSTGAVIGTVAYMSPEQARGEQLDARSDLFSCGALLYEMATAQQAFSGGTLATTFDALLNRNPIPPSQLNPQFTPAFDTVIARSLEKDRNRRYCSASALLGDLRQLEHRVHAAGASSELDIAALSPRTEFDDSIAVWPFEDVAGNDDTKYLCEAITETIINSLSRLTRLRVIPRTTIFAYRSKDTDPVQACRQLRARTVLSGRIRKTGDDLILDAELIDAVHNSQLWGAKYKRTQLDLLAVQQEISNEVSDRLRLHLTSDEKARLTVGSTRNREAFHLLVKGRHHTNKWTPDGLAKGLGYVRQAIEIDPVYSEAYALLAYVYAMLGYFGVLTPADAFPKAKAAAVRALEIDPNLAAIHISLALVAFLYEWDWSAAEVEIQRGITLAPNSAGVHFVYGGWLVAMGRLEEAISELERALDLDPLSTPISANLARAYYFARNYERALAQVRSAVELDPSFSAARSLYAVLLARVGRHEEAIAEARNYDSSPGPNLRARVSLGLVYAIEGRSEEARGIAEAIEAESTLTKLSSGLPYIYAALGDADRAISWLEECYRMRISSLVFIAHAPECDSLHADPRFADLLRRIGLPPFQPAKTGTFTAKL